MNHTPASSKETDLKKRPITKRALVQRINRALAKDGQRLMASRGMKEFSAFGDYYVVPSSCDTVFDGGASPGLPGADAAP